MSHFRVAGASLATEPPLPPLADRGFERARAFQNRVVEWINSGVAPVAVLRAPTGAGKTATFFELIESRDMPLLVYPTNALLRQQRERLEAEGIAADILNGNTLEGRAHERTENLIRRVNKFAADHDVVLTNPDILQAAIQSMYRGGDVMRFFNSFDAIVYDEFHFYDALAASGLLLQIKIITERHPDPKVLMASATPNEDFVSFLESKVGLTVKNIESSYDEHGDQFRRKVQIFRHEEQKILDCREDVASELRNRIREADDYEEPHAVVVFNSAKDSNDFHDFLYNEYPIVFKHSVKDNGFDTGDDEVNLDDEDFYVLNTTSKGEVGLDYDVRALFMEAPPRASSFLQRFGRAGRQSSADVHVFGLGQGPWSDDVDFQTFTAQIYEGLDADEMDHGMLADLVGLRAALAIADRERDYDWFNQELRADFEENVEQYEKWRGFVAMVDRECDEIKEGFEPGKFQENDPEAKLLRFTRKCFDVFRGLRGQSLPASIKYPRGDRLGVTTYDLTTTLRNYDVDHVEGSEILVLKPDDSELHSTVTARLPQYETEPTQYDKPTWRIEDTLQTKIHRRIDRVALNDEFEVSIGLLHRFFDLIRIVDAVVPSQITTANYQIDVEAGSSGPPSLDIRQREV